jgi:fluoride exporter
MRLTENGRLYVAVGLGSAAGSLLRYLVGVAVHAGGLPTLAATGIVNLVGCFVIMFFATLSGPDGRMMIGPVGRQAVMSGICGGLTTFSSMSLDTLLLLVSRRPIAAAIYLVSVIALSLGAGFAGRVLAVRLNNGGLG